MIVRVQVVPPIPGIVPMNCALAVLQCLHIFWFGLILKAVARFIWADRLEDVREDDA
jgi:hypothetical protein